MTERHHDREDVVYAAIIALTDETLLLPNSAVLDVLPMALLEPLDDAESASSTGLAGWLRRGEQRLPVIQFEGLLGRSLPPPGLRGRLVLLQGLTSPDARLVLAADAAPRRVTLNRQVLSADTADAAETVVAQRCRIARQQVIIPDLAVLEERARQFATL